MPFELTKRETVPRGVRRVIRERIDHALTTFANANGDASDHAVHEARKRFKEIRGTLRLVRDELGKKAFALENRSYRNAGRPLSTVRDAKVLVDSLDKLLDHFNGRIKAQKLAWLRRALRERRRATRKKTLERDHAVNGIIKALRAARGRVKDWPLERRGWKAIESGLYKSYEQGRRAMKRALDKPSDEALHEWRKRTKDLRYQLELLTGLRPQAIKPLVKLAHDLTDLLGDDHDLCVLGVIVHQQNHAKKVDAELIDALIAERRSVLQKEARRLGEKIYAERPRAFLRRFHAYWKSARKGRAT